MNQAWHRQWQVGYHRWPWRSGRCQQLLLRRCRRTTGVRAVRTLGNTSNQVQHAHNANAYNAETENYT